MLLEFVEKYIYKKVTLFNRLKQGLEDKIAFEDLWMLFDTGDAIYSPYVEGGVVLKNGDESHTTKTRYVPQVFRVSGTVGGLPLRWTLAPKQSDPDDDIFDNTLFPKWSMKELPHATLRERQISFLSAQRNKNKFAPLHVVCLNIDFDGVKYGPVQEIFTFKPYDGLVDIRSLEAYPMQYLKTQPSQFPGGDEQPENVSLLQRGRNFIDATVVSHLSHEGLSVGKSRHEINSAVVVDIKLSCQEYSQEFPDHEPIVPRFTSATMLGLLLREAAVIEFYKHKCGELWCHKSDCIFEAYGSYQLSQISQITLRTKALLEEDEIIKPTRKESLEKFKKYMEDNDLIRLLPGVVPAFALRNRKWVQLDLNQLKKLKQEDEWKKLVLPTGHREMVQAMVETHTRGSQDSQLAHNNPKAKVEMDLVQGKGIGCIILLHGVPGVGKTSTAECVAAHTRRPLYPITCGDIGYVPEAVEKNMEQHFKLAHTWSCVLLLDEADVFLAKRNKTDVKRNGLVSVFLRILEYYSGILFLTTNRVGAIDDAFRSRLHLTLYYPKLTEKQTTEIWKNNLGRIKEINRERKDKQQPLLKFDKAKILQWVKRNRTALQWNGRQIRNAFQTAVALAEFTAKHDASKEPSKKKGTKAPGPVIDIKHFKTIAEAAIQFDQYMIAVYGDNEDNLAAREQMRPKSFTPKAPKLKDLEDEESSESSESSSEDEEAIKSEAADESIGEMSSDDNGGESSEDLESESESESEKERKKKRKKKTVKEEKKKNKRESKTSSKDKKEKKGK
ncbi:hypothetical protein BKA56DRAFT_498091 [Ilyonectria sp. MPI-CAGE-AT-0026]|nr:hypothetical protein BKA56DRAFT_498091 [Ilyonectria sp. MPI-CAGE-AT-0026]